jgi:hypothetical protein
MCLGLANGGKIIKLNLDAEQALQFFKEELKDGKCDNDCLQCNSMEIAIKALEKQIPKKVVCRIDVHTNMPTGFCPVCKIIVHNNVAEERGYTKYCRYCGQALDWCSN